MWYILNMASFEGPGLGFGNTRRAGLSKEKIHRITAAELVKVIREAIRELFGSVITTLIEEFDRLYAAVPQAAATIAPTTVTIVGSQGSGAMQYREFTYTKPLEF